MSPASSAAAGPSAARSYSARFLRSELRLIFGRRRNQVLLAVLAVVPVLIAVAVRVKGQDSGGGSIFGGITQNGLFAPMAAFLVLSPLLLPLAIAVVAGDAVAGESSAGTLRYLLAVPSGRTRLLAVKFAAILIWCLAGVVVIALAGMVIGAALFPSAELTLLSGRTVTYAAGAWRLLLVAGYVAATVAMVGALGLFVSTMTEVPVAAMAATLTLTVVSEVADAVPQLASIHAWLPTHYWLRWVDLLRDPIENSGLTHGLLVTLGYVAVFVSLAWARFAGKDVTC